MAVTIAGMAAEAEARNATATGATSVANGENLRDTTTINTLQVKVMTASGSRTMSWKYASSGATYEEDYVPFFEALIANGEIFEYQPLAVQSAKLVTKTERDIEMS